MSCMVVLLSFLPWLFITWAQSVREKMIWVPTSNPMALCNDFTRAGFFIRRNDNSDNWVVFLESGGLCYNSATCNRRFFVREVRQLDGIRDDSVPEIVPYGQFDPSIAWTNTVYSGARSPAETVSPLMTSLQCFPINKTEGRDILDTDSMENPLFHDYNHVLIPYCSSDLWLGEETDTTDAVSPGVSECDCFNYTTAANPNGCFTFNTTSIYIKFTFRGKIIYQSIIEQLLDEHGLMDADRVILAGSSVGGVGVINHAKWTHSVLSSTTEINVLFDSSWFIDFESGLGIVFNFELYRKPSLNNNEHLFDTLMSNEACNDTDWFGYPCCISAHCILTQQNSSGQLRYYPDNTPTFALFSLYDIYLLAPSLATVENLEAVTDTTNSADSTDGVEVVFDFSAIVGEYGGIMNYTLDEAASQMSFLSYYVTQCFQHIYLATSTLWGDSDESVLGDDSPDFTRGITLYSNIISSGRWNTLLLAANGTDGSNRGTILEALTAWMSLTGSGIIRYRDTCQGVVCNAQCSGDLHVGELTSNNWHIGVKLFIAALVIGLAVVCIALKIAFICWLYRLEIKQDKYLESLETEELDEHLQFPCCEPENAMSVSCIDLCYSIKFDAQKSLKDERKDQTAPVVLSGITEEESGESDCELSHPHTPLRRRSLDVRNVKEAGTDSALSPFPHPALQQHGDDAGTAMQEDGIDIVKQPGKRTFSGQNVKDILKRISLFINPGEMVGIMGPSGCGKTALLDILSGRRKATKGEIYINGTPVDDIREWYLANVSYVLQLAIPYYEELTVRENLTLAAQMKLPKTFTMRLKFERVEQVLEVTGLLKLADTVVGGATGPGLSGGQKKRLALALQLLKLPSVIFLDEPTSGLDAAASFEVLIQLNKLADSNRTIVITIHRPRLEIFHMFHRVILLSDGKISYHGKPEMAYECFVSALTIKYLEQGLIIPSLEDHNPADVIMDMLGNPKMRQIITEHYQNSKEPILVRKAIAQARWKEYSISMASENTFWSTFIDIMRGEKNIKRHGSNFTRLATLEARAAKRVRFLSVLFLPFMFSLYACVLGTTYIQESVAFLVIAGVCVFSTASALFMFPAMYLYYQLSLKVYSFENAEKIGQARDIVIQGFIRFQSISLFPVLLSTTMLYLLLVNAESYNILIYLQVVLTNIALNQTWIALLIALICSFPAKAFRLSPAIAAVAGFSSGFFIPIGLLHWG